MKFKFNKRAIIWTAVLAVVALALILGLVFGLRSSDGSDGISFGAPRNGALVTNGKGCAQIGAQMLEDGGTTVDAAVAALLCEGVMLPQSMGLGGGFIAVIYNKASRKIETLLARETAPAAANTTMFVNMTSVTGAISAAVPGELLGYWEMHQKYGRLPWKDLFQPTIKLCREGHVVSAHLQKALTQQEKRIRNEPSLAEIFIKPDGSIYQEGDILKRPQLAATLEKMAEGGADVFYGGGEIGKKFVEDVQDLGGIITEDDLKNYRTRWSSGNHIHAKINGGYTLYTTPAPTSGTVLAFILNVLNGLYTDNRSVYWQRVIETFKHAYGQRTHLGDADFDPNMAEEINEVFERLQNKEFIDKTRASINDRQTSQDASFYGAEYSNPEDHGTANMAVLDAEGNAVVVTSTINNYFGGKVRSSQTGIIINDEMDDFATPGVVNSYGLRPSPANYVQPRKMPLTSMCPSIIVDDDGNVRLLIGAAGGSRITTAVATSIIKYLILNETMSQAVNDPRIHHQLLPMQVEVEAAVPQIIKSYLQEVGHVIHLTADPTGFAAVTAIGAKRVLPEPFYDRRRLGSTAMVQGKNKMRH